MSLWLISFLFTSLPCLFIKTCVWLISLDFHIQRLCYFKRLCLEWQSIPNKYLFHMKKLFPQFAIGKKRIWCLHCWHNSSEIVTSLGGRKLTCVWRLILSIDVYKVCAKSIFQATFEKSEKYKQVAYWLTLLRWNYESGRPTLFLFGYLWLSYILTFIYL